LCRAVRTASRLASLPSLPPVHELAQRRGGFGRVRRSRREGPPLLEDPQRSGQLGYGRGGAADLHFDVVEEIVEVEGVSRKGAGRAGARRAGDAGRGADRQLRSGAASDADQGRRDLVARDGRGIDRAELQGGPGRIGDAGDIGQKLRAVHS